MHAGEIYHLWEGLTSGYKLIEVAEMYLMNTEDPELQIYLKALTTGVYFLKIKKLEDELKKEGFTVPPRPESKLIQGSAGAGQNVKLTDKEVIKNMVAFGQIYIMYNARAVIASNRESVRRTFRDLMGDHLIAYKTFFALGKKRNIFDPTPPATAKQNSLNMSEIGVLWDALTSRHLNQVKVETYMASIKDNNLLSAMKTLRNDVIMPQMEKIENVLKNEGFTIPPRPPVRTEQYSSGQVNKIRSSDDETLGALGLTLQANVIIDSRSLTTVVSDDLFALFEKFLYQQFQSYEKFMSLAKSRFILDIPPAVTSLRI
ncbi:hypothetical protein Dtox_2536 [Desulfofarcimen acetoxidans DSM 771]|uniref:DUF3231 family protein n=1 Tax=Desulfofarcimen acetoxidans (strain ATCC 49208 / DSM 771 / KCTC 5769 / VKM B-1644 / 5575) TaxID=485916 RepID=C8W0T3_DESAS|nr:DUF3231 family protein [Desulfofarcimen acetoxidans]ACV63338.1 hypothetical protein Dtox_2536 [Desulfofarcimen acetoxidans DSM 771]